MKKWYKSETSAFHDAKLENCDVVIGSNGWTDIFYLIPKTETPGIVRVIQRSQRECGENKRRVIYKHTDGSIDVIDKTSAYRVSVVKRGLVEEDRVASYLHGYYTRREETSDKVRLRKEAARVSHELCDLDGKQGHEERQKIRREYIRTYKAVNA